MKKVLITLIILFMSLSYSFAYNKTKKDDIILNPQNIKPILPDAQLPKK